MMPAAIDMLRAQEGKRNEPYLDSVGCWTIGYGHMIFGGRISNQVAEIILYDDILAVENFLKNQNWYLICDRTRKDVLANMTFNLGTGGISGFHEMISALLAKDWPKAADEMLASKWASEVGDRATKLASIMRDGVFSA